MNAKNRLNKLEGKHNLSEAELDAQKKREEIAAAAAHTNRCLPPGADDLFTILAGKETVVARDGRPVTTWLQVSAEQFYQQELERGGPGLVYDEASESFFTKGGKLALSRDFIHLEHLIGDARLEAWESEIA